MVEKGLELLALQRTGKVWGFEQRLAALGRCPLDRHAAPGRAWLLIEKGPHLTAAARMLELAQRLGFDLADALAGDAELLPDLFERVIGVHADAEAHAQHALFAGGQ